MNKKILLKACDVKYLLVDDEFVPTIFSSDNQSVKNIITDEIAQTSLLEKTKGECVGELNKFGQKLCDA
ncbi:MAG: hypothetical protein ACI4PF_04590, partial [Christensenellales bacterium]